MSSQSVGRSIISQFESEKRSVSVAISVAFAEMTTLRRHWKFQCELHPGMYNDKLR